jgi:anti-sigma B factor antagonist
MPIMDLDLSTRGYGDHAVVSVGGEVDLETATRLGDAALAALRDVSPHLVLDLSGVTFMDSTGLKVLLSIQRRADLAGGSFALAGVGRTVAKVLALTGLDQSFAIYDTLADVPPPQAGAGSAAPPVSGDAAPTP